MDTKVIESDDDNGDFSDEDYDDYYNCDDNTDYNEVLRSSEEKQRNLFVFNIVSMMLDDVKAISEIVQVGVVKNINTEKLV